MNIKKIIRSTRIFTIGLGCILPLGPVIAADPDPSLPPLIQKGLKIYAGGGPEPALDTWRQGGLLENDKKAGEQTEKLKQMVRRSGQLQRLFIFR
ncbi:MAG: hypothetical protein DME26_04980 [Verrucomicrobia bacterium]|nr:MAG: hypothetical protein DME26_04980 [Verrucomicrobiota bacterium]